MVLQAYTGVPPLSGATDHERLLPWVEVLEIMTMYLVSIVWCISQPSQAPAFWLRAFDSDFSDSINTSVDMAVKH